MRSILVGAALAMAAGLPLAEQRITFQGIGAIRTGASVRDASRASGEKLAIAEDKPSGTEGATTCG